MDAEDRITSAKTGALGHVAPLTQITKCGEKVREPSLCSGAVGGHRAGKRRTMRRDRTHGVGPHGLTTLTHETEVKPTTPGPRRLFLGDPRGENTATDYGGSHLRSPGQGRESPQPTRGQSCDVRGPRPTGRTRPWCRSLQHLVKATVSSRHFTPHGTKGEIKGSRGRMRLRRRRSVLTKPERPDTPTGRAREPPLCREARAVPICRQVRHVLKTFSPQCKNELQGYHIAKHPRRQP